MHTQPISRLAGFFQSLSPASLTSLPQLYRADVSFTDPINRGTGLVFLEAAFRDSFKHLQDLRIAVNASQGDESHGFLHWTMWYRFRGAERSLQGVSYFRFDAEGLVQSQEDFWDASYALYGEFPVVGWVMRAIRRMVRVKVARG